MVGAMARAWLDDPTGVLTVVLDQCASLEDAVGILALFAGGGIVQAGEIEPPGAFVDAREMATLLSLELEARAGADIGRRYATYGEAGPEVTRHGSTLIERAGASGPSPQWRARLAALGVAVAPVPTPLPAGLTFVDYSVDIGRDFS